MRTYRLLPLVLVIMAAASCNQVAGRKEMKKMESCKEYFNEVIRDLSDPVAYSGRKSVNDGDIRAARYIIDRIVEFGALPATCSPLAEGYDESCNKPAFPPYKSAVFPCGAGRWKDSEGKYLPFLQHFSFDLNVLCGNMSLSVDGRQLTPAADFYAKEFSPSCKGRFKIEYLDEKYYTEELFVKQLNSGRYRDAFVVIDWDRYNTLPFESRMERYIPYLMPLDKVGGIIIKDASTQYIHYAMARAHFVTPEPVILVNKDFPDDAKDLDIDIESRMTRSYDAHNIAAYLPSRGRDKIEDQCITFVAHYDHLGHMGADNVFPGANDNASGVGMLLSLMKYWSRTDHRMPIQFLFLDAEESNLLGAFYYCANPIIPLDKIKCVINCDMVGDNGDSMHCQCDPDGEWIMDALRAINDSSEDGFADFDLGRVNDDSDHYAFEQAGVPSVSCETRGDFYKDYHTPRDTRDNVTDYNYHRLFTMLTGFVRSL